MGSLLDSYDKSLNRNSGDDDNPTPLNITHSFEFINEPEEVDD